MLVRVHQLIWCASSDALSQAREWREAAHAGGAEGEGEVGAGPRRAGARDPADPAHVRMRSEADHRALQQAEHHAGRGYANPARRRRTHTCCARFSFFARASTVYR